MSKLSKSNSLVSILVFVIGFGISFAATSSELQEKQKEIDNQIKEINSEIAGNKAQIEEAFETKGILQVKSFSFENNFR